MIYSHRKVNDNGSVFFMEKFLLFLNKVGEIGKFFHIFKDRNRVEIVLHFFQKVFLFLPFLAKVIKNIYCQDYEKITIFQQVRC